MTILIIAGVILLLFLWYILKPRPKNEEGFKMWAFNEKSWHARYYKWVVGNHLPQGGCGYFWSMFALVSLSPLIFGGYAFFSAIVWIIELFPERKPKEYSKEEWQARILKINKREARREKLSIITGKVFITIIIIGILVGAIFFFSGGKTNLYAFLIFIGCFCVAVGLILGIRWIWLKFKLGKTFLKILTPLGIPFKYMWSMIVAIYTKSCPKITWSK